MVLVVRSGFFYVCFWWCCGTCLFDGCLLAGALFCLLVDICPPPDAGVQAARSVSKGIIDMSR